MKLTLLPSDKGDCLLLEAQDGTTILIDGGMRESYVDHVRSFLGKWRQQHNRPLDLVYLSHIDQDHIAGVLQLMDDIVEWRVYRHKQKSRQQWKRPGFLEPPECARIWHNGFHDVVGDNAGEIGSMLAARAALLANSTSFAARNLGAAYRAIAASIPESIKLSSRVSPKQLKIPLNKEFGGKFAMVRPRPQPIRLNGANSPAIHVIGPFKEDLEKLREEWNAWLNNSKNKSNLQRIRKSREEEDERLDFAAPVLRDIDDGLGKRAEVTAPNLASLMLLIEQKGKRIMLTGDGHHADIVRGLEHNRMLTSGSGIHVDVLKIQHHGSEHNLKREFAQRVTADHYVICGNGLHANPDPRVLQVIVESRLGSNEQRSRNPEASRPFHLWFNCSVAFLERDIAKRKAAGAVTKEMSKARDHFAVLETEMRRQGRRSQGKLNLHFLKSKPLEIAI